MMERGFRAERKLREIELKQKAVESHELEKTNARALNTANQAKQRAAKNDAKHSAGHARNNPNGYKNKSHKE